MGEMESSPEEQRSVTQPTYTRNTVQTLSTLPTWACIHYNLLCIIYQYYFNRQGMARVQKVTNHLQYQYCTLECVKYQYTQMRGIIIMYKEHQCQNVTSKWQEPQSLILYNKFNTAIAASNIITSFLTFIASFSVIFWHLHPYYNSISYM